MVRNNVTRLLESRQIPFTVFELPTEKLGAQKAAHLLGAPLEQVFKTIVVVRMTNGKPILAVVPGTKEVNLKELAACLGEKKLQLSTEHLAEQITGLEAGGISPLALLNRGFQVVLDTSANAFDQIYISAGQRGMNIRLPVKALITLTGARVEQITR